MTQTVSNEKGKILFIPMLSQGHINYTIPITKRFLELYGDKVEIYFAMDEEWKNKIENQIPNVKFILYERQDSFKTKEDFINMIQRFGSFWVEDLGQQICTSAPVWDEMANESFHVYPKLNKMILDLKPNLIIFDQLFTLPYGMNKDIPWANLFSAAMNYSGCDIKMPPPQSGLPTEYTHENLKKWQEFINNVYKASPFKEFRDKINNFLKENGCAGLDEGYYICKISPYLNIYAYPKELDYREDRVLNLPGKWLRIETPVMKPFPEPFPIPEKLKNLPGKLIYFSFGSMASIYKPLFQKMLDILAQLPHRFIVSTGMIGHEYIMTDNMYGENYLNQFAVLQTVDMVISHGGNNTLTETFNFGKPLIILPLFGDQPDNAQRIEDKGLGKRLSVFDPPEKLKQDLENAIDFCSKESVVLKMKKASERIQKDSGLDVVCEELFNIVTKKH